MKTFGYEPAPLVLAFVLGRLAESPCGSRCCSPGSFAILVERPIAAVLLGLTLALIAAPALSALRRVLRTGGVEGNR